MRVLLRHHGPPRENAGPTPWRDLMFARRRSIVAAVLAVLVGGLAVSAQPATTAPATYFPLTPGTIWKYRMTAKVDDKPQKPYVQTITAGEPVDLGGQKVTVIDDAA